jgi:predicted nucleic acid-binding protein
LNPAIQTPHGRDLGRTLIRSESLAGLRSQTGFYTIVLSEFNRRGQPDPQVKKSLAPMETDSLYSSIITFGEIRLGIELLPESKRRAELKQWLEHDLHVWFEGRLLTVDEAIMAQRALLTARRQLQGRPLDILEGLLAATALYHGLGIATRNARDFAGLGVDPFNPWEA